MKPENNINYYYAVQALRLLVERGLLTKRSTKKPAGIVPGFSSQRRRKKKSLKTPVPGRQTLPHQGGQPALPAAALRGGNRRQDRGAAGDSPHSLHGNLGRRPPLQRV